MIRELTLYLTSRCNHRCVECRRQHGEKPTAPEVTRALVEHCLVRWPDIASVCIAGFGEPLLAANL